MSGSILVLAMANHMLDVHIPGSLDGIDAQESAHQSPVVPGDAESSEHLLVPMVPRSKGTNCKPEHLDILAVGRQGLLEVSVLCFLGSHGSLQSITFIVEGAADIDDCDDCDVRALPGVGISMDVLVDINLTMPDRCLDPVLDEVMPTADGNHVCPTVVQDVRKCLLRMVAMATRWVDLGVPALRCCVGWQTVQSGTVDETPVTEVDKVS